MKRAKILLFLTLIQLCFIINPFISECNSVLKGTKWEGKANQDIFLSPLHEEAFVLAHNITEEDENIKRVFEAYVLMRAIYKVNNLNKKYLNNEINLEELKQLLTNLYFNIDNPKTAKEYFYKGLFSYATYPYSKYDEKKMTEDFIYIIDNYSDTIYAKYSYLFLGSNYIILRNYSETVRVLKKYLEKYAEDDELAYSAYYHLSDAYSNLYHRYDKSDVQKRAEDGENLIKYSNKLLDKFPGQKGKVGFALSNLASYYSSINDNEKALKYYYKIFNDPEQRKIKISGTIIPIIVIHKNKKEYKKAYDLLENLILRYPDDKRSRRLYKEHKQNLDEIRLFGFDKYDRDNKENKKIYKEKKDKIEKWRKEYHSHFDKDFNIIKPFKEEKEPKDK
jgi:hypothetical protein